MWRLSGDISCYSCCTCSSFDVVVTTGHTDDLPHYWLAFCIIALSAEYWNMALADTALRLRAGPPPSRATRFFPSQPTDLALGPTSCSAVTGISLPGVKAAVSWGVDNTPSSDGKVRNTCGYIPLLRVVSWHSSLSTRTNLFIITRRKNSFQKLLTCNLQFDIQSTAHRDVFL